MPDEPLRVSFVMGSATAALPVLWGPRSCASASLLHLVHETAVVVLPRAQPRKGLTNSARFALVIEIDDDVAQRELEHDGHLALALGDSGRRRCGQGCRISLQRVDGVRQRLENVAAANCELACCKTLAWKMQAFPVALSSLAREQLYDDLVHFRNQ